MTILHDKDARIEDVQDKTIAIIGYGSQGSAQACCLRDSGIQVIIGETEVLGGKPNPGWNNAQDHGFSVYPVKDAAQKADIIHILLPDEFHGKVYGESIQGFMTKGKTLCCSHGFAIVYKQILPPRDVDVIMVAPKSPATEERKAFLAGFGVPGLIAIKQDFTGMARKTALGMAKAMGFTRAGVLECTFEQETYEDLFGEQNVLCGGMVDLMKYGFEVLTEAGYPPEMAYFEVLHELKLIVDLVHEGGIQKMNSIISNTAEWGQYVNGPKIIDKSVKQRMKQSLKAIEDGSFAQTWIEESKKGCPTLLEKRRALATHPIEIVGKKIRELFEQDR